MITKITLNNVASYKNPTALETDKKLNLIYGLNGTGKSTLSNYLHQQTDEKHKKCSIEGLDDNHQILVYNQTFIQENFFEAENIKGIFTLSKVNKDAQNKIANAQKELNKLEATKDNKEKELQKEKKEITAKVEAAKGKVWEIKQNYSGGDRVFEFCLKGYKSDGNKLLNFIEGLKKPENKPTKTIESIKEEVLDLDGANAQKFDSINMITFPMLNIDSEHLLNKQIVGNENSTVSELINKLKNSDWVRNGLKYLPLEIDQEKEYCPFCQEQTVSKELFQSIKDYFDESYEANIQALKDLRKSYSDAIKAIPDKSTFESKPKFEYYKKDFEIKYNVFSKIIGDNLNMIDEKIKSPSVAVSLNDLVQTLENVNLVIESVNKLIAEHNDKIYRKKTALEDIKTSFWDLMRWEYDTTISNYISAQTQSQKVISEIIKSIQDIETEIEKQKAIIIEQQKLTINIEEAITNINNSLIDLGIEDFKIKNHSEDFYTIVRGQNDNRVFHSLSEGEKMIISFMYFLELCRGQQNTNNVSKKKIIVIDDPISSLSHIYIFNIGRLIKNEFFGKKVTKNNETTWTYKYEQVFILTHSLYFFYEITAITPQERDATQKLFRISKNESGSSFVSMSYEEIQNDYQAYWSVVKDKAQHPALIANCMRNIIEYFFNFVEKKDLNNVFQKPVMQANRFQAFCRYINRESHSLGQNIFDIKEFNYSDFKDAFKLVFKENGYENHYNRMIK